MTDPVAIAPGTDSYAVGCDGGVEPSDESGGALVERRLGARSV